MMNKKLVVTIPEPCHEDWNKMTPDDKGRYCGSCNKSVYDFTGKNDSEIENIILSNSDKKICGHFNNHQLNRPLNFSVPMHLLPTNASPFRAFAMALFLVFGTTLFSCTNEHDREVGEITMVEHVPMVPLQENKLMLDTLVPIEKDAQITSISCNTTGGAVSMVMYDTLQPIQQYTSETVDGGLMYHYVEQEEPILLKNIEKVDSVVTTTEAIKEFSFEVYPNPSSGEINISYDVLKRGNVLVEVWSLEGTLMKTVSNVNDQYEGKYVLPTDVSALANGTYICRIVNGGKEKTTKFILVR